MCGCGRYCSLRSGSRGSGTREVGEKVYYIVAGINTSASSLDYGDRFVYVRVQLISTSFPRQQSLDRQCYMIHVHQKRGLVPKYALSKFAPCPHSCAPESNPKTYRSAHISSSASPCHLIIPLPSLDFEYSSSARPSCP